MSADGIIEILLSEHERKLIAKYGYPFEALEKQLKSLANVKEEKALSDDAFWWKQVLVNLDISIQENESNESLQNELICLFEEIAKILRTEG